MEVVDKEIKHIWNNAKKKSQEKVEWNSQRLKRNIESEEGIFKGVLIGDTELEELEKELDNSEDIKSDKGPVVYAGIKTNKI